MTKKKSPANAPRRSSDRKPMAGLLLSFARRLSGYMSPLFGFSFVVNILMLVAPLYMLQIYDRVITSGSRDTLIWLTAIAAFLFVIYAAAEAGRRRVASLAAERFDKDMSARIFRRFENGDHKDSLSEDLALLARSRPLLQNQLIFPFLDLPFAPLFLTILFFVHPAIGALGLIGGAVVLFVAVAAEMATRGAGGRAAAVSAAAADFAAGMTRQRSAMAAMGLVEPAYKKWLKLKNRAVLLQLDASNRDGGFTAASRAIRQGLQMLVLAAGAALAISQQMSPGSIVAGSIILARALGPIDQIVGGWRSLVQAATAWGQLEDHLRDVPSEAGYTPLPRPEANLRLDRLTIAAPGADAPLVRPFSIEIVGGQSVALVGPNGAGKTTVLQTLSGAWPPVAGAVLLGGRDLHAWPSADRGRFVGYLPQDVELLTGTVGENISRMQENVAPEEIFEAAQAAGAHDAILRLPDGYDTVLGHGGVQLSAGQRQQIGLARALFRAPVLLLLDEPTANLDAAASRTVIKAIGAAAERGAIVITSTHDGALIAAMETALVIRNGAVMSARTDEFLKAAYPESNKMRLKSGAATS